MEAENKNRPIWVLEEHLDSESRCGNRWWLVESIPMTFDEALDLANRHRIIYKGKKGRNPIIRIRNVHDFSESFVIF